MPTAKHLKKASLPSAERPQTSARAVTLWVCVGLALITFLTFLPVLQNEFVNYDDPDYVTANAHVTSGLSWQNIQWAFTTGFASNWHPLTWMSHMLDCALFGQKASAHHLVSLLFHIADTVLLFLVLRFLTNAAWPAAVVAAAFALHPCHVESVAWISERKDVLSAFFGLLSIWAYAAYVRRRETNDPSRSSSPWIYFGLSLLLFALGLMSKPMLVTWPFVLLLLDIWPLRRFELTRAGLKTVFRLLVEKTPFFALSVGSSIVTFIVQRKGGAVSTSISFVARIENAVVAYARYLGDLFWPHDLAVLYPHPGAWPWPDILIAAAILIGITVAVLIFARSRPYLLVGWLWFVGTLVPVIGFVQVGVQSMADRYTYLPFIGLFIMAAWLLNDVIVRFSASTNAASASISPAAASTTSLLLLVFGGAAWAAHEQARLWHDSETLFRHTAAVTKNNYLAYNNLGYYLSNRGQTDEAIENYRRAIAIKPDYEDAWNNLGYALAAKKQYQEAIQCYLQALKFKPDHIEVHNNLGNALSDVGQVDEAIPHYEFVLAHKPDHADAHNNYGVVLAMKGQYAQAIEHFQLALRYKPGYASAHSNLGNTYAVQHKFDEAIAEYQKALALTPNDPQAHNNLGNVYSEEGKLDQAVAEYQAALKLNSDNPEACFNLGMAQLRRGDRNAAIKNFQEALRLKPDYTQAREQLAALTNAVK
jgi:protein O-mannosyl-transferase